MIKQSVQASGRRQPAGFVLQRTAGHKVSGILRHSRARLQSVRDNTCGRSYPASLSCDSTQPQLTRNMSRLHVTPACAAVRPGLLIAALVVAVQSMASAADDSFVTRVRPVLQERCFACHGALKQEAGLRLDTASAMLQGSAEGAVVVPHRTADSRLLQRVTAASADERMPPEGEPLKPEQIAALREWIDAGAPRPAVDEPEADPRDHWAFRAPVRPAIPGVNDARMAHPIDAFLEAARRERRLEAQPDADRLTWLRRVTLDLTGLPPTLDEQQDFLDDSRATADATVVDRLLASPQYGERWGRHWMDIWRYSDWWGLGPEVRNSQKHIWHWRDWIIESLNSDLGYDRMWQDMLAADELAPTDAARLRATGFLARQYFKFNRTSWLDETIQHTFKATVGLTFNCAKCHDHKYDPLTQDEYYQLRAFFEPYQVRTELLTSSSDPEQDGIARVFDCNLDAPTYLHRRGDDRNPDTSRTLSPAIPAFLSFAEFPIVPVALPAESWQPGLHPGVLATLQKEATKRCTSASEMLSNLQREGSTAGPVHALQLAAARAERAAADLQASTITARAAADRAVAAQPDDQATLEAVKQAAELERQLAVAEAAAKLAAAGLASAQAPDAEREKHVATVKAAQEALDAANAVTQPAATHTPLRGAVKARESNVESDESYNRPYPRLSTGRRSALASWITDRRNPLTARVAVNHVWLRHFGQPLVPTVFDFGRKGAPPTHPELLDWLAVEFMESGWSLKHLHRLIVTSRAYRMTSSNLDADAFTRNFDPQNRFLWRMNPKRLEAQIVRDSLLHVAGVLDLTMGGPSIPVADTDSRRRSLYFVHSHNEHQTFLSLFDDASVLDCYRRAESIVPQQALALENSPLAGDMASLIADRISKHDPGASDEHFVRMAFQLVLGCQPTAGEVPAAIAGLQAFQSATGAADSATEARTLLILSLLNHNDFVTVR